jgi:hypothetical protein
MGGLVPNILLGIAIKPGFWLFKEATAAAVPLPTLLKK